jgi:hypothetical protein
MHTRYQLLEAEKWIGDAILSFVPLLLPSLKKLVMPCFARSPVSLTLISSRFYADLGLFREPMVSKLLDLATHILT